MASLTVRQLDEELKKRLRLRAARNGRSMEDEVRTILRAAAADDAGARAGAGRARATRADARAHRRRRAQRVLLIIGGGIAAYKSLDLIRRLQRARLARALRPDQGRAGIRHAAVGRRARRRARVHRPVRRRRASSTSATSGWRARPISIVVAPATADLMAKMADGHADDLASAVLLATDQHDPARAGDEPADVGATRRRSATSRSSSPTASRSSARTPARWRSAARPASAAWPSRWRSPRRPRRCSRADGAQPLAGQARAGHLRADARADRSGALHRQPLVRQAGPRHRRRRGRRRRRGHAGVRAGERARSARRERRARSRPRATCCAAVEAALPADVAVFAAAVADWRVGERRRAEDQEDGKRHARARAGRKSRHPRDRRASQDASGRSW